jgi:hypothetical protein
MVHKYPYIPRQEVTTGYTSYVVMNKLNKNSAPKYTEIHMMTTQ